MKKLVKIFALLICFAVLIPMVVACGGGKDKDKTYTYKTYLGSTPGTWNPLRWESNSESGVLQYLEDALLGFQYNNDKTSYQVVPQMASVAPKDVSYKYTGRYGVKGGVDSGYAWEYTLRTDLKWDDGTPINADTFVYSLQQMLDPEMLNRRADTFVKGNGSIYGAMDYLYSKTTQYIDIVDENYAIYPQYADYADRLEEFATSMTNITAWFGTMSIAEYMVEDPDFAAAMLALVDGEGNSIYEKFLALEDEEEGWIQLTDEIYAEFLQIVEVVCLTGGDGLYYDGAEAEVMFFAYKGTGTWEDVGFFKTGTYKFEVIFNNPITELFYLAYYFSGAFLVHQQTYDACKILPVGGVGLVSSSYGTTDKNTRSYGPYKMTSYVTDKEVKLEKNKHWYGFDAFPNTYQTTNVSIALNVTNDQALDLFLLGNMSEIALSTTKVATYSDSPSLWTAPTSYTYRLVLNSNRSLLETQQASAGAGVNKVMLSYLDFRKAISLCIDRQVYSQTASPASTAGFGLINYLYVSDYNTGIKYRDGVLSELALVCLYYGFEAQYEDITHAYNPNNFLALYDSNAVNPLDSQNRTYKQWLTAMYDNMTGTNVSEARRLFIKAFTEAVAAGDYNTSQTVRINFVTGRTEASDSFKAIHILLQQYVDAALATTAYAGKVVFDLKTSSNETDYWNDLRAGKIDATSCAWGGATYSPFTIIAGCYIDDTQRHEAGLTKEVTQNIMFTLVIDGRNVTASLWAWAKCLEETVKDPVTNLQLDYSAASNEIKALISTACEYYWLAQYCSIPTYYGADVGLLSNQLKFGSNVYDEIMGFGGIMYMTYKYDDATWATIKGNQNY